MDRWASGLYLVAPDHRRLVRAGRADGLRRRSCWRCAATTASTCCSRPSTSSCPASPRPATRSPPPARSLAAPSLDTLETCLDKLALARACAPDRAACRAPSCSARRRPSASWDYPVIVKPRRGAGSRGVRLVPDETDARRRARRRGPARPGATCPARSTRSTSRRPRRARASPRCPAPALRVDSGVSSPGAPCTTTSSSATATAVARADRAHDVANVQLRRDADGRPALLEVNPRFPGAMPLTIAAGRRHALARARPRPRPAAARRTSTFAETRQRALPRGRLPDPSTRSCPLVSTPDGTAGGLSAGPRGSSAATTTSTRRSPTTPSAPSRRTSPPPRAPGLRDGAPRRPRARRRPPGCRTFLAAVAALAVPSTA